jgi:uncharacterized protein YjbI with pentapeptide repeats
VVAASVLFIVVLLGPVTDLIAQHDVAALSLSRRASQLQAARETARTQVLTLGAGVFAAGALWFTGRNYRLAREGQVTDRYTKAIEQLGSDRLDVRLGGIYALERIARDSARDHSTVMEVLAAFIREHSREQQMRVDPGAGRTQERTTEPDVQAALTVIGRRNVRQDQGHIDLTGSIIPGASLFRGDFTRVTLSDADLSGSFLSAGNFTRAWLDGANLSNVKASLTPFMGAHLVNANLTSAEFHGSNFGRAELNGADLTGADLSGAYFVDADLTDACLVDADLTGAHLARADLTDVDFTGADFSGAHLAYAEPIRYRRRHGFMMFAAGDSGESPPGWIRDPDSGLLARDDQVADEQPPD